MMSARCGLSPSTLRRRSTLREQSHSSSCSTSAVLITSPWAASVGCPRRASTIRARLVKVPPEPITIALLHSRQRPTFLSCLCTLTRSRSTSRVRDLLSNRYFSVSRTAPSGSERLSSTRPLIAPISSRLPPPMSATRARPVASGK